MAEGDNQKVFEELSAEQNFVEVESLCMQCYEKGVSRFLLTRIPHFREIIVIAFECPHCGFKNNEVQSAQSIAETGIKQKCKVTSNKDLDRQVVVSEHASIRVDEIDLEIPPSRRKSYLNTIEGILVHVKEDLKSTIKDDDKQIEHPVTKLCEVIELLGKFSSGDSPFTFEIDDPSGNSYIENP